MAAEKLDFQMDLFETLEARALRMRFERVEAQCEKTHKSADRVRKGTYASINEVKKEVTDLTERLAIIERAICKQS